jgi:hypothetical protein
MENSNIQLESVVIRSSHALLDGLSGKAEMLCDNKLIRLILSEDSPQADLEADDEVLIPIEAVTFIHKVSGNG